MKHALAATAGLFTLALAALGQNVVIELGESFTFSEGMEVVLPDAPSVTPDGEEEDEEEETERSKKLAKLKFDRRPSAILEAWSTPPESEEGEEEEGPTEEPEAAEGTEGEAETADAGSAPNSAAFGSRSIARRIERSASPNCLCTM